MIRFLSALSATILFSASTFSFAGDCNKTVMGGGCTLEAGAGVAAHMRSQPVVKPMVAKVKEAAVKEVAVPKNVKMSTVANQKPQI